MKKMMLMLAILVTTISAFAGEENVNKQVLDAFKTEFTNAQDVRWTATADYYAATFIYNDKYLSVYYKPDGELMGLARNISSADLPLSLQRDLKEKYKNYWISELYEVARGEGTSYYITLENADTKLVLNTNGTFKWNFSHKEKKS